MTPASIAETALLVGDREGQKAMTMRRIATELGCDPMAIYRHFPNREALLDAVADLALTHVADPGPGVGWDARIRGILTGIRSAALRHPGIAPHVAARPPVLARHGRRLAGAVNAALADAGLAPSDVVHAGQALVAYVAAAIAMAVNAGVRDERWRVVTGSLDGLPGEVMPAVGSDEQFGYGLRLLLNGIRVEAAGPGLSRSEG